MLRVLLSRMAARLYTLELAPMRPSDEGVVYESRLGGLLKRWAETSVGSTVC